MLASSLGTYLYGRGMYETMVYWKTAHTIPTKPQFVLDWAQQWRAAEKIVYSRILAEPHSAHLDAVRRLKDDAEHDISVDGPEVAALCCGPSEIKESRQESLTETNQHVASLFE